MKRERIVAHKASCAVMGALLCAAMAMPCGAYAADVEQAETVKVALDAGGAVEGVKVSTVIKDEEGESRTEERESSADVPVKVRISYRLDGADVSAEDLAGKSGRVTIRYDYENTSAISSSHEGQSVPFTAMTVLMLGSDHFKNAHVTNGKTIEDGDDVIVAGYAFPGLKASLGDVASDADIPDYFEVQADATDFELNSTMTVVTAGLFSDIDVEKLKQEDLEDAPDALSGAMAGIIDGSTKLSDGISSLASGSQSLHEGIEGLDTGVNAYAGGVSSAAAGAAKLSDGAKELDEGIDAILNGDGSTTNPGLAGISSGLGKVAKALDAGTSAEPADVAFADTLNAGIDSTTAILTALAAKTTDQADAVELQKAIAQLQGVKAGITQTEASVKKAQAESAGSLAEMAKQISSVSKGLGAEVDGLKQVKKGSGQLASGAEELGAGLRTLSAKGSELIDGVASLERGSSQLAEGAGAALEGSHALTDGLRKFDDEGIGSINDAITNKYAALMDRMRSLSASAKSYTSFDSPAAGIESSVKFVYETAAVSKSG